MDQNSQKDGLQFSPCPKRVTTLILNYYFEISRTQKKHYTEISKPLPEGTR